MAHKTTISGSGLLFPENLYLDQIRVLHLHFHRNFRNFSIMEQSPESTSLINAFRKVMKITFKLTENGPNTIMSYMQKRPTIVKLFKI